jgi:hypothetical protein
MCEVGLGLLDGNTGVDARKSIGVALSRLLTLFFGRI